MDSLLSEMTADIIANKDDKTVTILHDKAFSEELLEVTFDLKARNLILTFANSQKSFGKPISDDFIPFFKYAATVAFLQIDMNTQKPLRGLDVPLKIIE